MRILTILSGLMAIAMGLICLAVDTWSNVEFIGGTTSVADLLNVDSWSSLMAAAVVIALASCGTLAASTAAFRMGAPILAAGLMLAWVCGAAFSLGATLDRAGSQKDAQIHEKQSHNVAIERTELALLIERDTLKAQQDVAAAECKGYVAGRSKDDEWPKCTTALTKIDRAQVEISNLERKLSGLGAKVVEDSSGERLAAYLPFITPKQVATFQPATLPLALFLCGQLLPAFGIFLFSVGTPARERTVEIERPMKDITPVDPVLAALPKGKAVSNRQLAKAVGLSEATTSRKVKSLIESGAVVAERNGRQLSIRRV